MRRPNIVRSLLPLASVERRRWKRSQDAKPVEICWVPQTNEPISASSRLKFTILWGHVAEILLFDKFFRLSIHAEDIAGQMANFWRFFVSCISSEPRAMLPRWRFFASFLRPVFPASHVQHVSDLHPKFALRLHHVWKYGRHPICRRWD